MARRLVPAYLTWRVLQRLRQVPDQPRPPHHHRRRPAQVLAMVAFLAWLRHGPHLASCGQGDVGTWLATGPTAYDVRDFLAQALPKHCPAASPRPAAQDRDRPPPAWELIHRLLRDTTSTSPTGPVNARCSCSASTCHDRRHAARPDPAGTTRYSSGSASTKSPSRTASPRSSPT
jgi:hypothetical protein